MPRKPKHSHTLWPSLPKNGGDKSSPHWKPTYNMSKSDSGIYYLDYYDRASKRIRKSLETRNRREAISHRKIWMDMDKHVADILSDVRANREIDTSRTDKLKTSDYHSEVFHTEMDKIIAERKVIKQGR